MTQTALQLNSHIQEEVRDWRVWNGWDGMEGMDGMYGMDGCNGFMQRIDGIHRVK